METGRDKPVNPALAVLHVALNPVTGPWSVMRELARAQAASGLFAGVGIGVVADKQWPARYASELRTGNGVHAFQVTMPKLFGTGQFLWQRIFRPPLARWTDEFAARTGAGQVIVHFHNAWLSGVFLPLPPTRVPVSVVATFHGIAGAASLRRQPVRRALHRWMARRLVRFDACLTSVDRQSPAIAEELFGLHSSSFSVVPNGVAPRTNDYGPFCRGAKSLTVAHVGGLTEGKGWRLAAEAVIALAQAGRPVRLLIAGDGPDEPEVRRIAAKNPACIEFLGSVQDPCSTVFPRADLFVLMTSNDGLPMAILEAMACGVPVVSTRIGGDSRGGSTCRDRLSLATRGCEPQSGDTGSPGPTRAPQCPQ